MDYLDTKCPYEFDCIYDALCNDPFIPAERTKELLGTAAVQGDCHVIKPTEAVIPRATDRPAGIPP